MPPDCYKILRDGELIWWSRSRVWAVLAAFVHAGASPIVPRDSATIVTLSDGIFLPLTLARFAAIVGPSAPGPIRAQAGETQYCYSLPSRKV